MNQLNHTEAQRRRANEIAATFGNECTPKLSGVAVTVLAEKIASALAQAATEAAQAQREADADHLKRAARLAQSLEVQNALSGNASAIRSAPLVTEQERG